MPFSAPRQCRMQAPNEFLWWILASILGFMFLMFLCQGCSTTYAMDTRKEWRETGTNVPLYGFADSYPSVYPATLINTTVSIPLWFWPFDTDGFELEYLLCLWPVGAALTLIDLPISIVSDTIMLPHDVYHVVKGEQKNDETVAKGD